VWNHKLGSNDRTGVLVVKSQVFWAVLISSLLLASSTAFAVKPILGFVVDGTSGEPLPVANVFLEGSSRGSSTNLDGFFLIPALEPGDYSLIVSFLGYQTRKFDVTVGTTAMKPLTIELIPSSIQLEEVIYTVQELDDEAKRESPRVSTVPVDHATIRMVPSLGAEMDVLRVVQSIPGVKASSEISSTPIVRGGSSDMTLILMDQSTVYNPSHMFGIFSTFNGDAVKHLELMKGGFPAEYGGRAGSVLQVVTNDGNRNETKGLASVGIVSARSALEGPLGHNMGSYAISGRRTYFEPVLNVMRDALDTDLPSYFFYDVNGKINLDITDRTTLTIGGYTGQDNLGYDYGSDDARASLGLYWGNKTGTARLRQVIDGHSFLTIGYALSNYESGADFIDIDEQTDEETVLQEFTNEFLDGNFQVNWEFFGLENHRIKTGISYSSLSAKVMSRTEDTYYVAIDATTSNTAYYIQDQWNINGMFEILPGLRATYHKEGGLLLYDPRMAFVYHYSPTVRYKIAGGRYHQFINTISAGEGIDFWDIWLPQDGTVDPTYSDQLILGAEWDFAEQYEFTFETYYNKLYNMLEYNDQIDEGYTIADAFLVGEGRSWGFEFLLRKKAGDFTGWLGYSLSWTQRRYSGTYINDGEWYYPKWDRRHDVIFVGMYKINDRWDISTQWRYNTGQGYTQGVGVYTTRFDGVPIDDFSSSSRTLLYGEKNNYRFPADHRMDIAANYHHHFFNLPATLNISVYNVYNRRAVFTRSYDLAENPVAYTDVKLLPILPLVSYEVRF